MSTAFRSKIIVGIDYGTTFSGIAYIPSKSETIKDPESLSNWPGGALWETREKVPSKIAYASENPELEKDVWGYEVYAGLKSYCWTKLLLDRRTRPTEYDDPLLRQAVGGTVMTLPPGKTAEDVVADFLKFLYQHCLERLEEKMTPAILAVTPLEFWFTMPAIWSDRAQHATKSAAEKAGFGSRGSDEIRMVTEPEAAALAALKSTNEEFEQVLEANTGLLVCDCGGGTVDITTYAVRKSAGKTRLEESCVGIGGKCGATAIDRNLHGLMGQRYGAAFTSLPSAKIDASSRFMQEFENHKRNFGSLSNMREANLRLRMNVREMTSQFQYDDDEGEVTLTEADIKKLFDPVVDQILALIAQQLGEVKKANAPAVKNLILVGGFGDSRYLYKKIKAFCERNGNMFPINPSQPWSAIARGAALRGKKGDLVEKRRCRRHYGVSLSRRFKAERHPFDKDVWECPFSKKLYRRGYMTWSVAKGDVITQHTQGSFHFFQAMTKKDARVEEEMVLYSCSLARAPDRVEAAGVERVCTMTCRFEDVNLKKFDSVRRGTFKTKKYYNVDLEFRAELAAASGVLQFSVWCENERCGTAEVDFNSEDDPRAGIWSDLETLKL